MTDLWCPVGGNNAMMLHRIVTFKFNAAFAQVVRIHAAVTFWVIFVAVVAACGDRGSFGGDGCIVRHGRCFASDVSFFVVWFMLPLQVSSGFDHFWIF